MLILCRVCGSKNCNKTFAAQILQKYQVDYFLCPNCGFFQTETPYWLSEAYQSPVNVADTGILARNIQLSRITAVIIYFLLSAKDKFLDFAGGYGIFTRLMRDIGFDFYWHDPYSTNLLSRGFELKKGDSRFGMVTAFEAFEHFVDPIAEMEKLLSFSDTIFLSTELLPNPIPEPAEWWYYGLGTGQHISFYSLTTLSYLAKKYSLNLYSNGANLHLFTKNRKINQRNFNFILKFCDRGLLFYVRKKMNSRTFDDMNETISKSDDQNISKN